MLLHTAPSILHVSHDSRDPAAFDLCEDGPYGDGGSNGGSHGVHVNDVNFEQKPLGPLILSSSADSHADTDGASIGSSASAMHFGPLAGFGTQTRGTTASSASSALGVRRSSATSPLTIAHRSSLLLTATPEDRQRAVSHMLARGASFSLERTAVEEELDLTPDSVDSTPPTPAHGATHQFAASAPDPLKFELEEVPPLASRDRSSSGLSGLQPRTSLIFADGRKAVIQTPNRYAEPVPEQQEYSESGQRRAKLYKVSVFLPTGDESDCLQMQLKPGTTALQLVTLVMTEYLRTHARPDASMLGQPTTYRLYMAEDDGELDDSFPPLDPTCVVSTTGANCFLLQRKIAPSASAPSGPLPPSAHNSVRSVSSVHSQARMRGRIAGMGIGDSDEPSQSRLDDDDADLTEAGNRYRTGSARTSSDAGDRGTSSSSPSSRSPRPTRSSFWRRLCSCCGIANDDEKQAAPKGAQSRI